MGIEAKMIADKLSPLVSFVSGDPQAEISSICSPDQKTEGAIVFIPDESAYSLVKDSNVAALVVPAKLKDKFSDWKGALLSSPHVSLALSQTGRVFFPVKQNKQLFDGHRIHPSAIIADGATVSNSAIIGPNCTISENCIIEDNVIIGPNTALERDCRVGKNTHLHAQVSVSHGTVIGANCEIHPQTSLGTEGFGFAQDQDFNHHRITHYGRLILEDEVRLGAGVTVDRGTFSDSRIGRGTIVDNLVHFGHNFSCGEKCIFVGGSLVAGSVTMGKRCVVGGRVTIAGHLSICDDVQIAGMSGVTKDITEPGKYGGYPLLPLNLSLKSLASLRSLPEMRKTLAELVKKVNNN